MATALQSSEHDPAFTLLSAEREPCPEGSVPLHQLCDRCALFVERWDIVNWKLESGYPWHKFWERSGQEEWSERKKKFGEISWKHYELCCVEYLSQSQDLCHLCIIVFSSLPERSKSMPMATVILSAESTDWDDHGSFRLMVQTIDMDKGGRLHKDRDHCYLRMRSHKGVSGEHSTFDAPKLVHNVPRRSIDNLNQIKQWLLGCTQHHHKYSTWNTNYGLNGKCPTRIIQVTLNGVRLISNTSTTVEFKYLALSHIWGAEPSQQLRLLSSRLEEFKNAIPLDELPQNFREAIRIVRYLGYQYLWIDSICIIQDSVSDWAAEAAKMSAVYSNAVCNLAFIFPPTMGFDQARGDPRCLTPCIIRQGSQKASNISISPVGPASAYAWLDSSSRPWSSRAWIFQEYLLSPRTVIYGHRNLMWECAEIFSDELLGSWLPQNGRYVDQLQHYDKIGKFLLDAGNQGLNGYLGTWLELVNDYRSRTLSNASDRIIAFAGVAEAFQNIHGLTYLAGIWGESLPYGLAWSFATNEPDGDHSITARDTNSVSAPSWSWFRRTIPDCDTVSLHFSGLQGSHIREVSATTMIDFRWPGRSPNELPPTYLHNFAGLQLRVRIATLTAKLQKPDLSDSPFRPRMLDESKGPWKLCYRAFEEQVTLACSDSGPQGSRIKEMKFEYFCDGDKDMESLPDRVLLALLIEHHVPPYDPSCEKSGEYVYSYYMTGLGLEPGEKHDTWKRVGFWRASIKRSYKVCYEQSTEHKARYTCEQHEPCIFLRFKGAKMETITLV